MAGFEDDIYPMFNRRATMQSIFWMCNQAGINRDDRIELAAGILDIGSGLQSYNDLADEDLAIIYWALRHWRVVQGTRLANGTLSREAHALIEREAEEAAESEADIRKSGITPKEPIDSDPAGIRVGRVKVARDVVDGASPSDERPKKKGKKKSKD